MIVLLLTACAELPPGWEGAVRVHDLEQTECAGDPYGEYDERVEADLSSEPVHVAYREAHFRCAQDVEAFALADGDRLDLLVQPVDMHPRIIPDCDCLYDVVMDVAEYEGVPDEVRLYRRWDALNEPNDPVLIGTVSAE